MNASEPEIIAGLSAHIRNPCVTIRQAGEEIPALAIDALIANLGDDLVGAPRRARVAGEVRHRNMPAPSVSL